MRNLLQRQLLPAIRLLIVLTLLTGVIYPAIVTAAAQAAFPSQANGSLIVIDGKTVGSTLIGQAFNQPKYLWGRPSAAGTNGYDASASGASNLGPTDPRLVGFVPGVNTVGLGGSSSATNPFATPADPFCVPTDSKGNAVISPTAGQTYAMNPDGTYACAASTIPERAIAYRQANGLPADASVPVDVITASASGLDPDISPAAAATQVARVAAARGIPVAAVEAVVARHTQQPVLGFLGEPRVNVLLVNLDLDGLLR